MNKNMNKILVLLRKFMTYFVLMAFMLTCNFMLFFNFAEIDHDKQNIAALLTFWNVVFLTVLLCVVDSFRRWHTVKKPIAQITDGMNRMIEGDFSIRIPNTNVWGDSNEFDVIIDGLNKMAQELDGVETLRGDFISNISHEMKTPMTAIQNYSMLLQSPELSEEKRIEYAKAITEQSRKLSALITNILKLNKLENQQIFPNREIYNLSEQLCECMLSFENVWEEKCLQIEIDLAENLKVEADRELLSLVWNNLISNAIKFTEKGGTVAVSLKSETGMAVVQVRDTGCGMSPETGRNIFKKFYQGDTSHATQGNGLGLALVKRVMDIIGGEISVSSKLGVGSTFTVKLPEVSHE